MKRHLSLALVIALGLVCAGSLSAQQKRLSPHETVSRKIDGNRVTIIYGRPYTRDPHTGAPREIWGKLVPWEKIWRLGADEATTLITQKPVKLGDLPVPAGAYTLFFVGSADGSAKLIVNKEIGQWGIDPYHPQNELGRVPLKMQPLAKPIHQLTIALDHGADGGGVLKIQWEDREYVVPYTVEKS